MMIGADFARRLCVTIVSHDMVGGIALHCRSAGPLLPLDDAVGAAVTAWAKDALGTVAGLTPVKIGPATCWVSPAGVGAEIGTATPRLLLVCGSMPGGSCGIWGRSLCINASTLEGAMFDYIRRVRQLRRYFRTISHVLLSYVPPHPRYGMYPA